MHSSVPRRRRRIVKEWNQVEGRKRKSKKTSRLDLEDFDFNGFKGSSEREVSSSSIFTKQSQNVQALLRRRELGKFSPTGLSTLGWQTQALSTLRPSKGEESRRRGQRRWRKYAFQSIPFTKLHTPPSDAVLAIERFGSYVLCLGGRKTPGSEGSSFDSTLALRFYGLPSPSLLKMTMHSPGSNRLMSPLLQTTPLLNASSRMGDHNRPTFEDGHTLDISAPMSIPVDMLISRDWRIGIAFLRKSEQDSLPTNGFELSDYPIDGDEGNLALFSLPKARHRIQGDNESIRQQTSFTCCNVRMGAFNAFTMRNLLWMVDCIPCKQRTQTESSDKRICYHYLDVSGYLFFNDEDDGYRLTWILDDQWDETIAGIKKPVELPDSVSPNASHTIIDAAADHVWEKIDEKVSTSSIEDLSGSLKEHCSVQREGAVSIAFEAYLNMESLLASIVSQRENLKRTYFSNSTYPDYFYNLIGVVDGGKMVELFLGFKSTKRMGCVGVFVKLNIFTQEYCETQWVKNSRINSTASLQKWCNSLALNFRMRQRMVGPYCVEPFHPKDWGHLSRDYQGIDIDNQDDVSQGVWRPFLEAIEFANATAVEGRATKVAVPKFVSYSSLYPDCDIVTNRAVRLATPVHELVSKQAPIAIVYE